MQPQKKSVHHIDLRKLIIRVVALLCAMVLIAGTLLAVFG